MLIARPTSGGVIFLLLTLAAAGVAVMNVGLMTALCASVLAGHILQAMEDGVWERVLFAATGALMSPTSSQQGESIPGICHAVVLEREG